MPQLSTLAALSGGYSPQLMRATVVLRMSAAELVQFISQHPNPCLRTPNAATQEKREETIRTRLHAECREAPPPPPLREVLAYLVECVDDDGFLHLPPDNLPTGAAAEAMEDAIRHLQRIAPPGVAARTADERLLLQLGAQPAGAVRTAAEHLIRHHWQWVQRKRWDKLPKRNLMPALQLLETLPPVQVPAPAARPTLPDVVFAHTGGMWRASAAAGSTPPLHPQRAEGATMQERRQAKEITAAIAARRRWLLAAAQYAADRQSAFLHEGVGALRPLPLQQAAADLRISPGMLSHILCGKRGISPLGEFPLKCLYGSHTGSTVLRHHLQQLVAEEPSGKPLSDAQLCTALARRGMHLARRTVSKHRQLAGIAPAAMRKRATPAGNCSAPPPRASAFSPPSRQKGHPHAD